MSIYPKFTLALEPSSGISDSFSLDDPQRSKCLNSLFYSLFHLKEKKQLNKQMSLDVTTFFQQRYGIDDSVAFKRIWKETGESIWSANSPLTAGILREIDKIFKQRILYHGSGISVPKGSFSRNHIIMKSIKALLHGGHLPYEHLNLRLLKAILISKDANFLNEFRQELQIELQQMVDIPPKNSQEEVLWKAFVGNLLALIPYTYPESGQMIFVPILTKEGECQLVEYCIEEIFLTQDTQITPFKALGFVSLDGKTPPILAFSGTTYPAGDGFGTAILADFAPGRSVGERPFYQGRKNLETWLEGKKGIHIVGMSLGGSLSLHTLRHHHEVIDRIDIYNPPGLHPWQWEKEYHEGCSINIYCQGGDTVSSMGTWPVGHKVSLYHIIPHQDNVKEGPFLSHAKVFTGCKKVTILAKDPREDNNKFSRKALTFLHFVFSPFIFLPGYLIIKIYQVAKIVAFLFTKAIHFLFFGITSPATKIRRKWKTKKISD